MKGIKDAQRIVVKVGTSTLTYDTGKVNLRRMDKLAQVISDLRNSGIEVALVTSAAIAVGVGKLGLPARPKDIPSRQAVATVGQCELMFMYDKLFSEYGNTIGQLLITRSDFESDERRANLSNSFEKLFEFGAIPVINENDSIAVEEIVFGDNDTLSAMVAKLVNADALIILSDIDGLYSGNPREDENALVTSAAIAVGVGKLGLPARPKDIPSRQAVATVGQCELMFMYDKLFSEYGNTIGQLLITRSDFESDERRANLSNSFEKLFEFGAIPVINENDSIAVEEIVFGDNDTLSAMVAKLVNADALIILSDIDGLYSGNPREDENAYLIPVVEEISDELMAIADTKGSTRGTGGMVTKLHAAQIATEAGIDTVVMNGAQPEDIYRLLDGRQTGTYFKAKA